MSSGPTYLSKDGNVSGPYTPGQIEALRQSGELYNFSWIWDGKSKSWVAIEEEVEVPENGPPPPPDARVVAPPKLANNELGTRSDKIAIPQQPATHSISNFELALQSYHLICHNGHTIMNGRLSEISQVGCTIQSLLSIKDLPTFKVGTRILVNLLNVVNGQSENTHAIILEAERGPEFWDYKVNWEKFPKILEKKR